MVYPNAINVEKSNITGKTAEAAVMQINLYDPSLKDNFM